MKKLRGQNREIAYQLPTQAKQTQLGKNECYLLSLKIDFGSEKQR